MKTKTLAVLTSALLGASAQANLYDLTPGGFDLNQPWPVPVQRFFGYPNGMQNLAGANIVNGQVVWSPFTIYGDDHFDITLNGTGADVGWDLTGTGYRGMFVFVESNELIANLYFIPWLQRYDGTGFAEIDGIISSDAFTFTGTNHSIPDSGSTFILMSVGLLGLLIFRPVLTHRAPTTGTQSR